MLIAIQFSLEGTRIAQIRYIAEEQVQSAGIYDGQGEVRSQACKKETQTIAPRIA